MKHANAVVFSLTRQQLALLSDPERKQNTLGPDSRYILEKRKMLKRAGNGWERTNAADKLLRALNALGVSL